MLDELKEQIILQTIRNYKNREEWTDEYIKEKYSEAIEYMTKNYEDLFENNMSNDTNITSFSEGDRSISYSNSTQNIVASNLLLKSLLGLPCLRMC